MREAIPEAVTEAKDGRIAALERSVTELKAMITALAQEKGLNPPTRHQHENTSTEIGEWDNDGAKRLGVRQSSAAFDSDGER